MGNNNVYGISGHVSPAYTAPALGMGAIGQMWNGPPNGIASQAHTLSAVNPPITGKKRKMTRLMQAQFDLIGRASVVNEKSRPYFRLLYVDDAINGLGWFNPLHSGRPKPFAQLLLDGVPAPNKSNLGWRLRLNGLAYATPYVVGVRKIRWRTTFAGLSLLKHWAVKHPKFQKFLDCYWSQKAEDQINGDCVDFALGFIPHWYQRDMELSHKKLTAKRIREKEEMERESQRVYANLINSQRSINQQVAINKMTAQQQSYYGPNLQSQMLAQNQLLQRAQSGLLGGLTGNEGKLYGSR